MTSIDGAERHEGEPELVAAGDTKVAVWRRGAGPPVLLLHGFPGTHRSWDPLLPHLGARQSITVDLPGYGRSGRPRDGHARAQADRVVALIDGLGLGPLPVIAHDWGGAAAWAAAAVAPDRVERLGILNAPHPQVFLPALRRFGQLRRSWYMFVFLLPWLPERLLSRRGALTALFEGGAVNRRSLPPGLAAAEEEALLATASLPGALAWYRDSLRDPGRGADVGQVVVPTHVWWGERDPALGPELAEAHRAVMRHGDVTLLPGLGHWPHWEDPEGVGARIRAFLDAPG